MTSEKNYVSFSTPALEGRIERAFNVKLISNFSLVINTMEEELQSLTVPRSMFSEEQS
jgi:hypothetical protein